MTCVLDTHVWVWWVAAPGRISVAGADGLAGAAAGSVGLPAICVWEVAKLVEKGRLALSVPVGQWIADALRMPGLALLPLTPEVCVASTQLPGDFHGDPADQIIVATARLAGLPLITADERIRQYPHVRAVW